MILFLLVVIPCAISALLVLLIAVAQVREAFRRPPMVHECDVYLTVRPRSGNVVHLGPVRRRGEH